MAVNFELYKVFMAAATNRSFSKAADELFVTQSAISQSILRLEQELGKQLFERSKSGLVLTEDGKFLLETISSSFNVFMSVENKLKNNTKKDNISSVKIACSPIIFKKFVFPLLSSCIKNKVNVNVNSLTSDKDKVFFVKEGMADFCLIKDYGIPIDLDLYTKKIFKLNYVFFYNPKFFNISSIDQISNYPIILKSSDTKGRKEFDKSFANIANNCSSKIEVSHDDLVISAVESGLGVGYAPKEYISDDMKYIVPEKPFLQEILLIYKRQSPIIKDLILQIESMK